MPALQDVAVGGGSDGNFTAGIGVPTLDGLGAVGDGAHAEGEHVLVSAMPERTAPGARPRDASCCADERPPVHARRRRCGHFWHVDEARRTLVRDPEPMTATFTASVAPAAAQAGLALSGSGLTVRALDTLEQVTQAEAVLGIVWRSPEKPPIAAEMLRAIEHAGGYVFGTYEGSSMIGVSAGFLGVGPRRRGQVALAHLRGAARRLRAGRWAGR